MRFRSLRSPAAAGVAASLSLALLSAPPVAADDTPSPEVVTLVGSLQDELGCDVDWSPGCAATALAPVPGTTTWEETFAVPAGTYALKVALDRSWDESYGADGSSRDIPLALTRDARLTVSYDHTTHKVAVAPADLPPAEVTATDEALAGSSLRQTSPENFYFVMADRFANGDPGNDTGGIDGDRLAHGFDPTDKGFFHGGDVEGLRRQLDYIEGLGTTAIWLTPSFANRPVQGAGKDASAGYHGYWVTDFTRIDPHFGTNAELEALIDDAHARGIKVYFDIITNHTADVIDYAEGTTTYVSKEAAPYRDAEGNVFDDADFAGRDDFPVLDAKTSFPYTPVLRSEADRTVKVPAWLNDPANYHNRGDSTFAGESSTYGDFVGLDDLFTEKPEVVDGMTDIYEQWVRFGIDGFRIDTVKHVNTEFWQEFAPAIRAEAKRVGNPDFFAFGEVYDANPEQLSTYTGEAQLDAVLDFGFQQAGVSFAKGGGTTGLRDFFAADDWYTDRDSNAYSLPTFLGNHDMGRVGSFLDDSASGQELLDRDRLAHSLMYLTRGQPVVYYGDEQGFTGPGGDKDARQDMFATRTGEYADDDQIGTDATPAQDNLDPGHPLYREISALAELRRQHPALADGAQLHRYASGEAGVYAFSRISGEENREYVVALNNSDQPRQATFATETRRGTFRQVWPATDAKVRTDREARMTLTVPPLSSMVLRAAGTLAEREAAPDLHFASPGAGATVGGRAEIRVDVPDGGFNQVTLAWRPVGATQWTALGTDDNAPYRVRHDVRDLADGSLLEYRAVLKDSTGNLSVASSYGVVGEPARDGEPGPGGGPVSQPGAVAMAGSHNSELGCPGDWQPGCDQAQLSLDPADQVWKKTVDLPAGDYAYKAAIDRSWDENYGAEGVRNGGNVPLELDAADTVTFYYDHATHWITTDADGPVITAPGSFQSELGCPGDWAPGCMRPWLQDPDGDGTYTFSTTAIPAGSHQVKVAHGLTWDENYGAGGERDGGNITFDVPADGSEVVFRYDLATHALTVTTRSAGVTPDLEQARAHWLREDLVAWKAPDAASYRLHFSPAGDLAVDAEAVTGGDSVPLARDADGLPAEVAADFPHLAGLGAFRLARTDLKRVEEILRGQVAVAAYSSAGALVDATAVQLPGVLDQKYAAAADRDLGVTWSRGRPSVAVWAPTARDVDLLMWRDAATEPTRVPMTRGRDGAWSASGPPSWKGAQYRFDVRVWSPSAGKVVQSTVTDPYSLALTTDSKRSVMVDLDDPALAPTDWAEHDVPGVESAVDQNIYELHVRDFSIGDESVPPAERGTYRAFTRTGSAGMTHLAELAEAGLNTVHLLPVFDIATIRERRADQRTPECDLASYAPDSAEQQACVGQVRGQDGFNWGYDPLHYTAPEGSYATDPEGTTRTREFRGMVKALHDTGLRVVMDVVYNHTAASGQAEKSVLDRIVPGYYHRLSATGAVETSTCCENTATEHRMMEKLMIDSVVTWAKDYRVDGFRFDLMGHHSKANMLHLRAALDELTLARDGVDGSAITLYGEGWNFGEVADDARFEQATQANLAGTGIGSFSDRLRDAVRGGGPFDEDPRIQGFGSGLAGDPNGAPANGDEAARTERLRQAEDLVKLGLAGNLADFAFLSSSGSRVTGAEVDYNGQPAGYAEQPGETVTYVDAHDNETLFDALTLKLPTDTAMSDRVRMNTLSLATVALSQGTAFWHAGTDLLRSKSLDRNSYDSGDWFNRVDWTGQEHALGSGLPPAWDNEDKWPFLRPLLADPALRPGPDDIAAARQAALDLLRVRTSTPMLTLGTADAIGDKVSFLPADPGVIVMRIDDTAGADADPQRDGLLVVFNATAEATTVEGTGDGWSLHAAQAGGADDVVKRARVDRGTASVPARTVAVFER